MSDRRYAQLEVEGFLASLAEAVPTPGGGSAAALAAASAAALVEMVAGVSQRSGNAPKERLGPLCDTARQLRQVLTASAEADADAYASVDQALKLPRDTEEQTQRRRELLQEALMQAARVPMETAQKSLEVLKLAEQLLPLTGKHLASDLSCAVRLASACAEGALDNVDANALSIRDEHFRRQLKAQHARLRTQARERADAVLAEIERMLSTWR